jgi:hypothetical protein
MRVECYSFSVCCDVVVNINGFIVLAVNLELMTEFKSLSVPVEAEVVEFPVVAFNFNFGRDFVLSVNFELFTDGLC